MANQARFLRSKAAEFKRLASFGNLSYEDSTLSRILLARDGFHLVEGLWASCQGCLRRIDLRALNDELSLSHLHQPNCLFVNEDDQAESAIDCDGASDGIRHTVQEISLNGYRAASVETELASHQTNEECLATSVEAELASHQTNEECLAAAVQEPGYDIETSHNTDRPTGSDNSEEISHTFQENETEFFIDSDSDSGYSANSPDGCSLDTDVYTYEHQQQKYNDIPRDVGECSKNPGHYGYFRLRDLRQEQLPSSVRCPELVTFLKTVGKQTVRISVSNISQDRPTDYPRDSPECGTGFITRLCDREDEMLKELLKEKRQKSKIKGITKKFAPFNKKQKSAYVYIRTSRHIVFDAKEAASATVELFDDSEKNAVKLKGKYVLFKNIPGENNVLLVCKCPDRSLFQQLVQAKREMHDLAEKLPKKVKMAMVKKVFLVHHPHGQGKVISYGDSVMVRYEKKDEKNGQGFRQKLVKLTGQQTVTTDERNFLNGLFYVADTCPGSSGAPVICFRGGPPNRRGQRRFYLKIWTHTGVDKVHKLNGSVLTEYTHEDFHSTTTDDEMAASLADDEDEESLGNKQVNSSYTKVVTPPSYPSQASYLVRCQSFYPDWKYDHIHKPEILAGAGFFYAGYSDCVRCFQCGLGLRSWKEGDDINTEHLKNRPSCPFLQLLLSAPVSSVTSPADNSATQDLPGENVHGEQNEELKLVKNENVKLREQLTCRICFKAEVKELFLPCGELCACSDCSKLLTHCPSCGKQILATVTTYFT